MTVMEGRSMKEFAEELRGELGEANRSEVAKRAKEAGLQLVFKSSWYKLMAKPGTRIGRKRVILPLPVAASVRLGDIEKWLDANEKKVKAR